MAKFRSAVFTGLDVFIPAHLAIHISAKPSLMTDAYVDFEQHFKWSYHFESSGEGQSNPYNPDYDLHLPLDTTPPVPPPFIENGL